MMKKRILNFLLMVLVSISLIGCNSKRKEQLDTNSNVEYEKTIENEEKESKTQKKEEEYNTDTESLDNFTGFDKQLFEGKIRDVNYGNDNFILVRSDNLYLYDSVNSNVIANENIDMFSDIKICRYNDGYALFGMVSQSSNSSSLNETNENECLCIIYDNKLVERERLSISEKIPNDVIVNLSAVAISTDSRLIAWSTLEGIYEYNIESEDLLQVYQYNSDKVRNKLILGNVEFLSFVENNKKLAFLGNSFPISNKDNADSILTYGTMDVDGKNVKNKGDSSYVADEIIAYNDFMYLPANFKKANGTLLYYTFKTEAEKFFKFKEKSEGKDGIFGSDNGDYFATAILGDDLVIRIYEKASGELIKEHTISGLDEIYYYRMPQVLMLENSRTCIVLLGRNQVDIETEIVTFDF